MSRISSKFMLSLIVIAMLFASCSQPENAVPIELSKVSIVFDEETGAVSMHTASENAEIYYTLDGTIPTTGSDKYEGSFNLEGEVTIKAVAHRSGVYSEVAELDVLYYPQPTDVEISFLFNEETKEVSIVTNRSDVTIGYAYEDFMAKVNEYTGPAVHPSGVTLYVEAKNRYNETIKSAEYTVPKWAELDYSYDRNTGLLSIECSDPHLRIVYTTDSVEMLEGNPDECPVYPRFNMHLYPSSTEYTEPISVKVNEGVLFNLYHTNAGWILDEDIMFTVPLEAELSIKYTEDGYFEIVDENEDTKNNEEVFILYTTSGDNPDNSIENPGWWNTKLYKKGSRVLVGPGVEIKAVARSYHSFSEVKTVTTSGPYVIGGKGELGIIFYDVDADNDSGNDDGLTSQECGYRYLEASEGDLRVYEDDEGNIGFSIDPYSSEHFYDSTPEYTSSPASHSIMFGFFKTPAALCFANGTASNTESTGTGKAIGKGKANTSLMLGLIDREGVVYADFDEQAFEVLDKEAEYGILAGIRELNSENEEAEWFIPSYEEMKAMYETFLSLDVGNLYGVSQAPYQYAYWTSSEFDDSESHLVILPGGARELDSREMVYTYPEFDDTEKIYNMRQYEHMVRPVRTVKAR